MVKYSPTATTEGTYIRPSPIPVRSPYKMTSAGTEEQKLEASKAPAEMKEPAIQVARLPNLSKV